MPNGATIGIIIEEIEENDSKKFHAIKVTVKTLEARPNHLTRQPRLCKTIIATCRQNVCLDVFWWRERDASLRKKRNFDKGSQVTDLQTVSTLEDACTTTVDPDASERSGGENVGGIVARMPAGGDDDRPCISHWTLFAE